MAHRPCPARGRLHGGEDGVLGRAEGVDEDVAVRRCDGVGEDGGGGEAGGGEEGEVCERGAGVGYGGCLGTEVEAEEAVFETPVWLWVRGGRMREGWGRTSRRMPRLSVPSMLVLAPVCSPCIF